MVKFTPAFGWLSLSVTWDLSVIWEVGPMDFSLWCITVVLVGKTTVSPAAGWEDMECGTIEYDSASLVVIVGVWIFPVIICEWPRGLSRWSAGVVDDKITGCEDSWCLMYFSNE